jgi:hypothetical protein
LAWAESPTGATLPEVLKFPLQNSGAGGGAALKTFSKDTKPKGFSP